MPDSVEDLPTIHEVNLILVSYPIEHDAKFLEGVVAEIGCGRQDIIVRRASALDDVLLQATICAETHAHEHPGEILKIRTLDLVGHGAPGVLGMGSHQDMKDTAHLLTAQTAGTLEGLTELLSDGATIRILGCDTFLPKSLTPSAEFDGPELAQALADLAGLKQLGVSVYGTSELVQPHHFCDRGLHDTSFLVEATVAQSLVEPAKLKRKAAPPSAPELSGARTDVQDLLMLYAARAEMPHSALRERAVVREDVEIDVLSGGRRLMVRLKGASKRASLSFELRGLDAGGVKEAKERLTKL